MINPSRSDSLREVNGKGGFNPTEMKDYSDIQRLEKKAVELECIAMGQGGNLVLALNNTQQYSRQMCTPLRYVQPSI
jgi:hypothetical protein